MFAARCRTSEERVGDARIDRTEREIQSAETFPVTRARQTFSLESGDPSELSRQPLDSLGQRHRSCHPAQPRVPT